MTAHDPERAAQGPAVIPEERVRSFLKERGRSTRQLGCWSLIFLLLFSACSWARRGEASGSRIGPQGRPRSGRRSLTPTPDGARCSGRRDGVCGLLLGRGGVWSGACSSAGGPAGGQAPGGAVGHSFAARGGMECCDIAVGEVNQEGATTP